jgi:hypothetical protein
MMNERIQELAEQCGFRSGTDIYDRNQSFDIPKFAELVIEQCCRALNPMLRDMISRGQGVDMIKKHFGVEE